MSKAYAEIGIARRRFLKIRPNPKKRPQAEIPPDAPLSCISGFRQKFQPLRVPRYIDLTFTTLGEKSRHLRSHGRMCHATLRAVCPCPWWRGYQPLGPGTVLWCLRGVSAGPVCARGYALFAAWAGDLFNSVTLVYACFILFKQGISMLVLDYGLANVQSPEG